MKNITTQVTLDYPVKHGGETVETLTMRRPITNDEIRKAERIKKGGTDQEVQTRMFADMCGVDYDLLCLVDLADQQKLVSAYEAFFPQRTADGETSPKPAT